MKTFLEQILIVNLILLTMGTIEAQGDPWGGFTDVQIDTVPLQVQPMTGIVFWQDQFTDLIKESISLEFNYMLYNEVVDENGVYNWNAVESRLDDIASRKHQSILRFRYVYPGYETSVPDYLKKLVDYHETQGISEGEDTWFPDWTHPELKRFTLEFYTKFAEKYDNDPRLAFVQVGFGLWAEYHIYSGPFELGVTFPSKDFQANFFRHLDTTFIHTPFSCSIDAADNTYSPFEEKPELLDISFGNFDDSFMYKNFDKPGDYNAESWKFFGEDRYQTSPAGGEFSYYSNYDQRHALDWPDGPYGHPFEYFAGKYHITYMIGNDQAEYQTPERIKEASRASGYRFKIVSFKTKPDSSLLVVANRGVAPFYYDAYITVNGIRSDQSLKYLNPGQSLECRVAAGGENPVLTIESDRLVSGQSIGYYGTENDVGIEETAMLENSFSIYPTVLKRGHQITLKRNNKGNEQVRVEIWSINGRRVQKLDSILNRISIETEFLNQGFYLIRISGKNIPVQIQKIWVMPM